MRTNNKKVRRLLESSNFKDIHFFPHSRFSHDIHFQGLSFDGCCSLGKQFVLFQCKSNRKPSKEVQEQMKIASNESGVILLWFNVVDRKGIEVYS